MRAEAQVLKGHLDTLLLATLEDGPRHGYAVKEALHQASGARFDLPTGTIYPALRRLESAGPRRRQVVGGRRPQTAHLRAHRRRPAQAQRQPGRLAGLRLDRDRHPGTSPVPSDLISTYLADLRRRLPEGMVDEIADGLAEASEQHLARELSEADAAHAALAEFGDADQLATEFTQHAVGRRAARIMLASGPVIGACWGAALIITRAWTWPVPAAARIAFGSGLLLAIAALASAAASQHSFRRTRLAAPGGIGLIILDVTMIIAVLLAAPAITWVLAIAITASSTRAALAARIVPHVVAD